MSVNQFSFDFRARSFNFLQQYKFLELMNEFSSPLDQYFLHYENEQNYTIQKMLDDFPDLTKRNIFLEFSDLLDAEFYRQFNVPFFWHFHPNISLDSIVNTPLCRGIVFSYAYIYDLYESGNFFNFVKVFLGSVGEKVENKEIQLVLSVDWDADIFSSLFDFLPISLCSLTINNKVELNYRNPDILKISHELKHFQLYSD